MWKYPGTIFGLQTNYAFFGWAVFAFISGLVLDGFVGGVGSGLIWGTIAWFVHNNYTK
jgi:hypothetical protein